jgi:organic radical activating enzyme
VHLSELFAARADPCAGLYLSLTRRCPLHCAHCSTRSTPHAEQHSAEPFLRLVGSFRPDERPGIVSLTGGEPLLRPRLVCELADLAARPGARTAVLSGMFFAVRGRTPPAIRRALEPLDHVSASIDRFHEREVPRAAVLGVLRSLLDDGKQVSVHLTGDAADDPYLERVIGEIRRVLDDRCPIYVALLAPVGRASEWLDVADQPRASAAEPCRLASWPVVAFDGTVVACCNQAAIDGPVPAHLRLGHAAVDGWPAIAQRARESAMLRAIRTFGPRWIADQDSDGACDGYCETCLGLSRQPAVAGRVDERMRQPRTSLIERHAVGTRPNAADWVEPARFAHLLELGRVAVPA